MHNPCVVTHLVSLRASAGNSALLGARLNTLVETASNAPGSLNFALHKSMTEESVWLVSGMWVDASAMNDWFTSPELGIFAELVAERLVSSLDFRTFANVTTAQARTAQ
ncbi:MULTISPECIES: antibiotic biosynthesis monooxygenase family protein [unclassified Pseudomonas]|uniref:antibiotic biosynthesis monooxygenase family protein n=1 Tax=unclassified Pseudomonas TaxID=196821 RepID=UPI0025D24CC8|nr:MULTISPECIES: antibiotic biosynthesis monooxygenase family protein [unclassified Pseudomonas]